MSTRLFLRSQQLSKPQPTHPLIAFRLQDEWFALPVFTVDKVIPLSDIYDDPQRTGMSLTLYQNQELLVIDIERILGQLSSNLLDSRFLLVITTSTEQKVGLPINSLPVFYQVLESAFLPLKDPEISQKNLRCLSDCLVQVPQQPPLFMLNLEKLMTQVKTLF